MKHLSVNELRRLCNELLSCAEMADEMAANVSNTTGESAVAYTRVHDDYIWKIKQKVSRMWAYVGDNEDIRFFQRPVVAAATPMEPLDYTTIPTITQYIQMPRASPQ